MPPFDRSPSKEQNTSQNIIESSLKNPTNNRLGKKKKKERERSKDEREESKEQDEKEKSTSIVVEDERRQSTAAMCKAED